MRIFIRLAVFVSLTCFVATGSAQEPGAPTPVPPAAVDSPLGVYESAPPPAAQRAPALPEPPRAQPLPRAVRTRPGRHGAPPPAMRTPSPRQHGDASAPLALGMGGFTKWRDDRGYARLSRRGERQRGFELSVAHDVLKPLPRIVLAIGASYRVVGGSESDAKVLDYAEHELTADLIARYRLLSWLTPHVRASAGLVATRLEVSDADLGLSLHDRGFTGSLGAGLTFHTPSRAFETRRGRLSSLMLGVLVEGGYGVAPAADFRRPRSERAGLERVSLDLGSLARSAPSLRISGVMRF